MLRWFIRCFLAGLFTILPLVITAAIVMWVAEYVSRWLGPGTPVGSLFERVGLRFAGSNTLAYVIGWVIVLGVVFGLGVLVEFGAKRWIQDRLDNTLGRVPMLGGVYATVRQLVGMMDVKGSPDLKGMSVVFCVFGAETGAAFLALLPTPECFRIGDVDYQAVIIPSAPRPRHRQPALCTRELRPSRGHLRRRLHEHLRLDGRDRPAIAERAGGKADVKRRATTSAKSRKKEGGPVMRTRPRQFNQWFLARS